MKMIFLLLPFICQFILTVCIVYNSDNITAIFEAFKEKYNKNYKSDVVEKKHLLNFVINFNKVSNLNEKDTDKNTFYIVNQYADLDPVELDEHFAIQIKPYFKVNNEEAEYLGRQRTKDVNSSELFDLDNSKDLFKEYLKQYNKNYTKKMDRKLHYYRFVKTLAEMNNKILNGDNNVTLDEDADVIKEPNEYFFDE